MLKAIKELLVGARKTPEKFRVHSPAFAGADGYFMPVSAEQLLNRLAP